MYLTPIRFQHQGFGSNLTEYDAAPATLASILNRASAMADAFLGLPLAPQRFSLLGGTITGERHHWRLAQTPFESAQRRVYPRSGAIPIRSVSSFRIYVTQPDPDVADGQYVLVAPSDLMINRDLGYIEVVSSAMTSTGLFNALIVPAIYLAEPNVVLDYTYGWRFAVTADPCYPIDSRVYLASNEHWTDDAVTVWVDGVEQTSGYTVKRGSGQVIFDAPPAVDAEVTASYTHKLPFEVRDAVGYIATHLIEESRLVAKDIAQFDSVDIAGQIKVSRKQTGEVGHDPVAYLQANVPEAAALLSGLNFISVAA